MLIFTNFQIQLKHEQVITNLIKPYIYRQGWKSIHKKVQGMHKQM